MATPQTTRAAEIVRGLAVKRRNALVAGATGLMLALGMIQLFGFADPRLAPLAILLGIVCGVLYANAFEYVLHRFVLHWGRGFLAERHALHHNSAGTPEEARYVNFATSPWVVVLVFVLNAPAALLLQFGLSKWTANTNSFTAGLVGTGAFGVGVLAGFTIYYIVYEEIHWRIHLGGWLPHWMKFARRHHMLHHADVEDHYSVFLPLFDWIFSRLRFERTAATR